MSTADPYTDSVRVASQDASLGELLGKLGSDLSELMRKEVELAKVEVKETATHAGKAAGMFSGAAVAGLVAVLLLAFALAWGLAEVMPPGLAFLIVGLLFGGAAAVLAMQGRKKLQAATPVAQQTVETIKEDVAWAKTQMH